MTICFAKSIMWLILGLFIFRPKTPTVCTMVAQQTNPELLFRLLFVQFLYNLSDECVIQEAQVNLAYKWFIGLNPEDTLPFLPTFTF